MVGLGSIGIICKILFPWQFNDIKRLVVVFGIQQVLHLEESTAKRPCITVYLLSLSLNSGIWSFKTCIIYHFNNHFCGCMCLNKSAPPIANRPSIYPYLCEHFIPECWARGREGLEPLTGQMDLSAVYSPLGRHRASG